jgi:hypothetical protein
MKLNDRHIEVIEKVRAAMTDDAQYAFSSYICVQIDDITLPRKRPTADGALEMRNELITAVEDALVVGPDKSFATMYGYIFCEVPGFKNLHRDEVAVYARQARLAWLDKMIESREIV